jgi:hypothetical protein
MSKGKKKIETYVQVVIRYSKSKISKSQRCNVLTQSFALTGAMPDYVPQPMADATEAAQNRNLIDRWQLTGGDFIHRCNARLCAAANS